MLGPAAGAILGGVFGICSLISNTMAPTLLSFAFSPFMSTTGIPGAIKAVWISVGCRILIGVAAGWLWILFSKLKVNSIIALPIVGFAGAMVNTITVMGSIYILFAKQYAEAKDVAVSAVWGLVMGTVTASGIPEAIAAAMYRGKKTFRLKKESREVFFCYVFIRKKLPVTGSVDTKKQKFCKKIKKLKNSVDRCMINMV